MNEFYELIFFVLTIFVNGRMPFGIKTQKEYTKMSS